MQPMLWIIDLLTKCLQVLSFDGQGSDRNNELKQHNTAKLIEHTQKANFIDVGLQPKIVPASESIYATKDCF
jgi:hypothetical protein